MSHKRSLKAVSNHTLICPSSNLNIRHQQSKIAREVKEDPELYGSESDDDDFDQSQSNAEEESSEEEQPRKPIKGKKGQKLTKQTLAGKKRLAREAEIKRFAKKAFIDDEASSDDELSETKGDKKDQYYDPAALQKKTTNLDLDNLEEKYRKRAEFEDAREEARR